MPTVPDQILRRLDELIEEGDAVPPSDRDRNFANPAKAQPWRAASLAFLERVLGPTDAYTRQFNKVSDGSYLGSVKSGTGILRSVKHDLEGGYLLRLSDLIAADLLTDVWDQAEELLNGGYKDAAASVCGAALESGLRKICQSHDISTGGLRGIDALAKALVDAGNLTAVKKRQIDAWREIRNAAAHGERDAYVTADVRQLLDGVRDFIADALG